MSIDRDGYGDFTVFCNGDECHEMETFFVDDDWQELMSQMRSNGWTSERIGDDWEHFCARCSQGDPE